MERHLTPGRPAGRLRQRSDARIGRPARRVDERAHPGLERGQGLVECCIQRRQPALLMHGGHGIEPDRISAGVFSRFEAFDSATPDEHLRRVEELIGKGP